MKAYAVIVLSVLLLASCASELKKRCKDTNWFQYGESVALSGKRLNSESFIDQCKNEDVDVNEAQVDVGFKAGMGRYCTTDGAVDTGRKGDPFNADLCDPGISMSLRKDHLKGVESYCRPRNGFEQGALGKEYKNVCPEKVEDAFLKQFRAGRRTYLNGIIQSKQSDIEAAERAAEDAGRQENRLRNQLTALTAAQTLTRARRTLSPEVEATLESERSSLEQSVYAESSKRRQKEREVEKLRSEVSELRVQLGATDSIE